MCMRACLSVNRVATNLENWEYSGISLNMESLWNSQGILCNLREKLKQSIFSSLFKYLVRVPWWPVILLVLMWNYSWWRSLLHLLFIAIKKSKFMALEKPGKLGDFFSYFVATLVKCSCCYCVLLSIVYRTLHSMTWCWSAILSVLVFLPS